MPPPRHKLFVIAARIAAQRRAVTEGVSVLNEFQARGLPDRRSGFLAVRLAHDGAVGGEQLHGFFEGV